jgi:hypothetical protein
MLIERFLLNPATSWLYCAAVCLLCAYVVYTRETRLVAARLGLDAYRKALADERAANKRRGARGFDWRDSHLLTRVDDDQRLTRVWVKP